MAGNKKSYKEHYRRLLFMEEEQKKFFHDMSKAVSLGQMDKTEMLLDILKKEGRLGLLARHRENEGESMLHVAAKFNQDSEIISLLIRACPELMTTIRKESDDYYGQTPLHIAIAKGNIEAAEAILCEILNHSQTVRAALLHQMATGSKFANTVMMGELPLSVAALTFNSTMIEVLLQNGAEMDRKNTKGDTVFHTLIRYAAIYPDHLDNVIATLELLHTKIEEKMVSPMDRNVLSMECDHSDFSYIWFVPNSQDLNPLQLASVLSQSRIFRFILNLPKVYSFHLNHDGLFDKKLYDITEIDTIATEKWAGNQRERKNRMRRHVSPAKNADGVSQHKFSDPNPSVSLLDLLKRENTKSILEIMFDVRGSYAYDFIQQPVVRQIIKTKWLYYRIFYYSWMVFHLLFMIALTVFAVLNADTYGSQNSTSNTTSSENNHQKSTFLNAFGYIYLLVGVIYLFHEAIHVLFRVKRFSVFQLFNVLHNGSYRLVLVLFSLCLIIDFILSHSIDEYENISLIIALISGWWFMVFFLRAHQKFSFFTVMIQKVLFGDMLRFGIIISLFLIAFTAGMNMAFKGSSEDEFQTYGETMLLLFKLMLGLNDIEVLYQARRPWLAVTLFIIFVLLTYVLMFNALIAMMSQTCMLISENRLVQWRVQQLSVIIFFEGFFPKFMAKLVGIEKTVKRFDPEIKQVIDEKRYYLDMSSIQTEYANPEDIHSMNAVKYRMQTLPFEGQRTYYTSFASPRLDDSSPYSQPPETSMLVKRRASRREKSPKTTPVAKTDFADHANPKAGRKKSKKKRVEPEGDINTSLDDNSPGRDFYLNQTHLKVPVLNLNAGNQERRRYNSENGLMDTHIGRPQTHQIPVQPAHIPVEQISRMAGNEEPGALDIGVIHDSCM